MCCHISQAWRLSKNFTGRESYEGYSRQRDRIGENMLWNKTYRDPGDDKHSAFFLATDFKNWEESNLGIGWAVDTASA